MEEAWDWDDLDFSFRPTDSMAMATVDEGGTWGPCELQPFGPLQMHPSAGVLNYGQGLFEGMKAYNTDRGRVVMFRPELNAVGCRPGPTDSGCLLSQRRSSSMPSSKSSMPTVGTSPRWGEERSM